MDFGELALWVRQQGVRPHVNVRTDCPVCGGVRSFSITCSADGWLKFHCFRVSCAQSQGSIRAEHSVAVMKEIVSQKTDEKSNELKKFKVPVNFVKLPKDARVIDYLTRYNCARAYVERRANIMWDAKDERVVFICTKDNIVYDAVGRAINKGVNPRWKRYGSANVGFFVPHLMTHRSRDVIITEDPPSACSASSVTDAFALCGTSITKHHLDTLRKYNTLYVVLDPDARKKALQIFNKLNYAANTVKIIYSKDEFKYFKPHEIKKIIRHGKKTTERFIESPFI